MSQNPAPAAEPVLDPVSRLSEILFGLIMTLTFTGTFSVASAGSTGSIVKWTFDSHWFWLSYFFIFPLITMRLFT